MQLYVCWCLCYFLSLNSKLSVVLYGSTLSDMNSNFFFFFSSLTQPFHIHLDIDTHRTTYMNEVFTQRGFDRKDLILVIGGPNVCRV